MILFQQDWSRYPTAIADKQTKNRSFFELSLLYRDMKVKNNAFLLSLMQPELQGFDVHEKGIDPIIRARMATEAEFNPWYYFREVVRLPPNSGNDPDIFLANRGNIALYWCFFNHVDCANIQPRQTGKSASTDCLMDDLLYIMARSTKIMMITKDDMLRQANIERLKGIRSYLPTWLISLSADDAENQKELTCKALGNKYVSGVGRSSRVAANNLGRGLSTPILHVDEGPFISWIGITIPAALASGTKAREQAAAAGQPYGNIFTTTAGKIDDRDGRYMYDLIMGGTVWNEIFLDARHLRHLRVLMNKNSGGGQKPLMNITMSHRQLGRDDEWLFGVMAENNSFGEDADRDFLNIWTSGTQRSPLTSLLNEAIRNSEAEPEFTEITPDGYMIRWYIPESEIEARMAEGHYSIGLDTSDAVGRDAIAMVMTDLRDLSTVAVGSFNETFLPRFSNFLLWLMLRFPNTILIPERKSSAQGIIDHLLLKLPLAGEDPFKRIYNEIVDNYREDHEEFAAIQRAMHLRDDSFYERRKKRFGFNTTAESRKLLYTIVLQNAAKQAGHLVRDRTLSNEIRKLVEKNGRIDHEASGHDDHVIAWLLSHYFPTLGKNLAYYGIDSSGIMVDLGVNGRAISAEERLEKTRQEEAMAEMEQLIEVIKDNKTDPLMVHKHEHRLRALSARIDDRFDLDATSIDAMIRQAGEERRKRVQLAAQRNRYSMEDRVAMPSMGGMDAFMRSSMGALNSQSMANRRFMSPNRHY
jgi:hypothetical protein